MFFILNSLAKAFLEKCMYNQILKDDGNCIFCYQEGANFEGCLRCLRIDDAIECVECSSGFTPQLSNGKIQRCVTLCSNPDNLAGYISNEAGTENCNINMWASNQFAVPYYDMFTTIQKAPEIEIKALEKFYYSLNGVLWKKNFNWLKGDPCQNFWYGIQCNLLGNIMSIVFGENRLIGLLPPEITNLKSLEELTIYNNFDSYSEYSNRLFGIEKRLNELYNLKSLTLRNLNITEGLSSGMYSFAKLEVLDLSFNKISGTLTNSITNLKRLKRINLSNNHIFGSLNSFNGFTGQLEVIELQNNFFTSNVPSLDNLATSLKIFDFTNNDIYGGIPTNFFDKKKFIKFIYMGIMLNPRLIVPVNCERHPFCFSSLFYDFRDANNLDFVLTDEDKMYLNPIG